MIYVFVGQKNKELEKALSKVILDYPEKSLELIDASRDDFDQWYEQIFQESMFHVQPIFKIQHLEENKNNYEVFLEQGEKIAASSSAVCIVIVPGLLAAEKKRWDKIAKVEVIKEKEKVIPTYNAFQLANVLATGDRKKAWITFHELISHDDEMEKMHGMLWWKVKDMLLKKSVFSQKQLLGMAKKLVHVYYDARTGGLDMKEGLEKFFLELPDAGEQKKVKR
jgi:DNA polymerase III delta subunit